VSDDFEDDIPEGGINPFKVGSDQRPAWLSKTDKQRQQEKEASHIPQHILPKKKEKHNLERKKTIRDNALKETPARYRFFNTYSCKRVSGQRP